MKRKLSKCLALFRAGYPMYQRLYVAWLYELGNGTTNKSFDRYCKSKKRKIKREIKKAKKKVLI